MLLAEDALTIVGIAVGFGLWLALYCAIYRWGPFEDAGSIVATIKAAAAKRHEHDH
jgi:hypothetical protein